MPWHRKEGAAMKTNSLCRDIAEPKSLGAAALQLLTPVHIRMTGG